MTDLTTAGAPARHRARFHDLTVADVERLTDESVAITFTVPPDLDEVIRVENLLAGRRSGETQESFRRRPQGRNAAS